MRRRRRRNNPSVSNTAGWVVLGIGAVVAYEIYKNGSSWLSNFFNQFKPGSGPTSIGTEAYEALTGQSPCAPMVANGSIQMPDGTTVPVSCYPMTMISGTDVAEVQTANGPVYVQSGNVNAQGAYVATTTPPSCACYSSALLAYSCGTALPSTCAPMGC